MSTRNSPSSSVQNCNSKSSKVFKLMVLALLPNNFCIVMSVILSRVTVSKAFVIPTIMKRAYSPAVEEISAGSANNKKILLSAIADDLDTTSPADPLSEESTKAAFITKENADKDEAPPLYLAEGLLAVHKPLTWTCNDVVSYIRNILTRDAFSRGFKESNAGGRKKRNKPLMRVGHGGTLDPLASGVLVLGIGKGTSQLQSYLEGDKQYTAVVELGYETSTLDVEGDIVKTMDWNHVKSIDSIQQLVVPKFTGNIQQVPPLYSAIRVDGKRLYEIARSVEKKDVLQDVEIPTRQVEVYSLEVNTSLSECVIQSGVVDGKKYKEAVKEMETATTTTAAAEAEAGENAKNILSPPDYDTQEELNDEATAGNIKKKRKRGGNNKMRTEKKSPSFDEITVPTIQCDSSAGLKSFELPLFTLNVSCGGGTYIRSLVRDIGYELNTVATMTGLVRTKQGPFLLEDALKREDWKADKIYEAIVKNKMP